MGEECREDDLMDIEEASRRFTPLSSPAYGPLEITECTEKEEEVRSDDGDHGTENQDDEEEEEEEKAARRKAKASLPPPIPENDDDDDDDKPPNEPPRAPELKPLLSSRALDTEINMDTYWALEAHSGHEIAARNSSPSSSLEMQFGDADASRNDTLPSHSPSSPPSFPNNDHENKDTTPVAPINFPAFGALDSSNLMSELTELQQQQQHGDGGVGRGRGRGRGQGQGWGFAWQESMTPERVEKEGWGDPNPSPSAQEEMAWEIYDESAWEGAAAEPAAKQETTGKVVLKVPHASFSSKETHTSGDGRLKNLVESDTAGEKNPATQRGELVMAVRDYKAILRGTYLSYRKDDLMRVVFRDGDGMWIYVL